VPRVLENVPGVRKKMDLDEPVNAELDPEEALRLLLGEERLEDPTDDATTTEPDQDE
jgi:hypothetical protein